MADRKLMRTIEQLIDTNSLSPFFKNFLGGPNVRAFEKAFARYVGVRYAVSMASGTLALNAAYTALDLHSPDGTDKPSEIICSPWTFVATASEIVRAGYKPVFADVEVGNGALSVQAAKEALSPRTGAVVFMHPLGSLGKCQEVGQGLVYVEDSCQALRRNIGCWGDIACFSFQQTKSASLGEGGMCVTNSREFYDRLCYLRNCGEKYGPFKERFKSLMGTNLRLTEIQAAIGLHALKGYDRVVRHQLMLGKILKEAMESSEGGWLIPQDPWTENGYIFVGRIKSYVHILGSVDPAIKIRERFLERVKRWSKGVPGKVIGGGYSELVYELPAFRAYARRCPVAEMWRDHAVWFDIRKWSVDEVKQIAREVERFKS